MRKILATLCIFLTLSNPAFAAIESDQDPYESVNREILSFNFFLDRWILKPIAKGYRYITPTFVDKGITNFFNNLEDFETLANSIFQLKLENSAITLNRIIFNTTFGLGGLIDVSTEFDLVNEEEDFGQTLGYWGYTESDYVVLPLLGPSTFRDTFGRVVDIFFDPLRYIDDIHDDTSLALTGLKVIDLRADALAAEHLLDVGDKYIFLRNAYLQNREYSINDGEVEDPFANSDFEEF